MTTLSDIVTEANDYLHSFTATQEDLVALSAPINDTDLLIQVDTLGSLRVTRGAIQIDDELIWVGGENNGVLTVPAFGRGFKGSTAAAHTIGSMVMLKPIFPRKNIENAILQTQQEVFPEVYAVKTTSFTYNPAITTYSLPSDCNRVISVTSDQPGPTKEWYRIDRWRLTTDPNTGAFPAGKAITLGEPGYPGRSIQVVYTGPFGSLADAGATLASCGHQESHKDLLILGACWRLIQFADPARLQLANAEAQARGQAIPPGSASTVARQVYSLFQQRLVSERQALNEAHPLTSHITR